MTREGTVSKARTSKCVHHWLIDAPSGRESTGTCKRCGMKREFANSTENVMWEQTNTLRNELRGSIRIPKRSEMTLSDEN
jgi:hypothetical protein